MSATNTTPNIGLPSFIGTDKPAWLTDWNGAMSTIDTEIGTIKTGVSGDETRIGNLENSVSSLNTTVSNHTTSITALNTQVATQGGTINTITSLIGNGTPTTTDQTIIGAINEINANVHNLDGQLLREKDRVEVKVSANGTETYKDLLIRLRDAVRAYITGLSDGKYASIDVITGTASAAYWKSPNDKLYANDDIPSAIRGSFLDPRASDVRSMSIMCDGTNGHMVSYNVADDGTVAVYRNDSVTASGDLIAFLIVYDTIVIS